MARDVNVFFGQPIATGTNVSVPQYSMEVRFEWTDNAGETRSDTRTILFPNVLQQIPAARVQEFMQDIIIERARTVLGVD